MPLSAVVVNDTTSALHLPDPQPAQPTTVIAPQIVVPMSLGHAAMPFNESHVTVNPANQRTATYSNHRTPSLSFANHNRPHSRASLSDRIALNQRDSTPQCSTMPAAYATVSTISSDRGHCRVCYNCAVSLSLSRYLVMPARYPMSVPVAIIAIIHNVDIMSGRARETIH